MKYADSCKICRRCCNHPQADPLENSVLDAVEREVLKLRGMELNL